MDESILFDDFTVTCHRCSQPFKSATDEQYHLCPARHFGTDRREPWVVYREPGSEIISETTRYR